jgi:hypothetical protein
MIEPTVGRVVLYRAPGHDPAAQPFAAHVAFVHSNRLVNLLIIDHDGITYPGTEIPLLQDGDQVPVEAHRGYAEWMPYQKGQAAKTEALQATLAGAGGAPPTPAAPQASAAAAPAPQPPPQAAQPAQQPQEAAQAAPQPAPAPEAQPAEQPAPAPQAAP